MVGLRDTTGSSAFALAEYIDALVTAEELDEEEFLRYVGPVDHEVLRELFRAAREEKDAILIDTFFREGRLLVISEEKLRERIWKEIDKLLQPEP